jgi:hypothetical protein
VLADKLVGKRTRHDARGSPAKRGSHWRQLRPVSRLLKLGLMVKARNGRLSQATSERRRLMANNLQPPAWALGTAV